MNNRYYLVGKNLKDSKSPEVWKKLFIENNNNSKFILKEINNDCDFEQTVRNLLAERSTNGVMITSPFKEKALAIGEIFNSSANKAKCANLLFMKDNRVQCYSTDYIALTLMNFHNYENKIFIIGNGAMAKLVEGYLNEYNANDIVKIKRNNLPPIITQYDSVINASTEDITNLKYLFKVNNIPKCKIFDFNYKSNYQHQLYTNGMKFLELQAYFAYKITQNAINDNNERYI